MSDSLDIEEVIQVYNKETETDVDYHVKLSIGEVNKKETDGLDFYFYLPLKKDKIDDDIIKILDLSIRYMRKKVESVPDGHTNSHKFIIANTHLYVMICDGENASYSFLSYILIRFNNILSERLQESSEG